MKCQDFNHPCDSDEAERYRMNTQYIDEESNYMVLCKDCQKDSDECWQEMWEEYYSAQGIW